MVREIVQADDGRLSYSVRVLRDMGTLIDYGHVPLHTDSDQQIRESLAGRGYRVVGPIQGGRGWKWCRIERVTEVPNV